MTEISPANFRVRFAPSPTGSFHVGGARTALFNYLLAKSNGGVFVLRIEDTDAERSNLKFEREILSSLKWLGIAWDEGPEVGGPFGPYYQSERGEIYEKFLNQLIKAGKVYPCFCSQEILTAKKELARKNASPYVYDGTCRHLSSSEVNERLARKVKFVYRFANVKKNVILKDKIKGEVKIASELLGDFIVATSKRKATYNFSNVVDDLSMKITHVIRGDDHLTNAFKQILLFEALGSLPPIFAHVPLILGDNKEKLSKRHGAVGVLEFKKKGYYSEPLVNHLALLGWSPKDEEEVIPREKLEKSFEEISFAKSPAVFDYERLNYLNGLYLRNLPEERVLADFREVLTAAEMDLTHPKVDEILLSLKNQCKSINDILKHYPDFFVRSSDSLGEEDMEWLKSEKSLKLFRLASDVFSKSKEAFISPEEFKELVSLAKQEGIKGKSFFIPLRLQLTGRHSGMELNKFIFLNRREDLLSRL